MICLSDATGSMRRTWATTKEHIKEMLRRIEEIGGDNLQLMWVAYRDYSDGKLLEKSAWTRDPAALERFVDSIRCGGGVGPRGNDQNGEEAVEHALAEVRREHASESVTRVILLG